MRATREAYSCAGVGIALEDNVVGVGADGAGVAHETDGEPAAGCIAVELRVILVEVNVGSHPDGAAQLVTGGVVRAWR